MSITLKVHQLLQALSLVEEQSDQYAVLNDLITIKRFEDGELRAWSTAKPAASIVLSGAAALDSLPFAADKSSALQAPTWADDEPLGCEEQLELDLGFDKIPDGWCV